MEEEEEEGGFLRRLFGNIGKNFEAATTPQAPPQSLFALGGSQTDPERTAKQRALLEQVGLDDQRLAIWDVMTPEKQDAYVDSLIDRGDVNALLQMIDDPRASALPDSDIRALVRKMIENQEGPKGDPSQLVPEHLRDQFGSLSSTSQDAIARKRFETLLENPSGIGYRVREGAPKLRIMQDDAFMRSGLKSGDVVCIKIP
jgi:hypothetical protein